VFNGQMALTGEYAPSASASTRKQVEQYERSGGTEANTMLGKPIIIVTSIGASSGKLRKNPVMRVEQDGRYAAVGSKGGAPRHPAWYHNLIANPHVTVQDGPHPRDMTAHLATGAERAEWWARAVEAFPQYASYEKKTNREIPVFVLEPIETTG
jgi:deazaflavin-dependent oxidoreductase (nitroreductase family)